MAEVELPATVVGTAQIELADAADRYESWPAPTAIICDGPYGVAGFPGDPPKPDALGEWYAPHAAAWARYAMPETTLWFWGERLVVGGSATASSGLKRRPAAAPRRWRDACRLESPGNTINY